MQNKDVSLVRALNLGSATAVVAGSVIGSGVFLVASDIAKSLPSPGWALMVWVVAGLISLMGGLTFAELGAAFPGAGGQYVYLKEAFGPLWGFLFGWTWCLIVQPGSIAAVAIACTRFVSSFHTLNKTEASALASGIIFLFTTINLLGIRKVAGILDAMTFLKVLSLVAIAGAGVFLPQADAADFSDWSGFTAGGFGVALIAAFWAFDGWNNVTFVAGEIENPRRNLPLSLFGGILAVTILYGLVSFAYYRFLPVSVIAGSDFVAGDAAKIVGGVSLLNVILYAVILSALGCVNGMILAGARISYAMAHDGALPKIMAYLDPKRFVPSVALFVQMLFATLLVWSGSYDQLFTYVVCAAFIFYALTALAVIVLRFNKPEIERPYRVPLYPWLPAFYILFCVAFVANAFWEKPLESLIGLGIVLAGVPAFYFFRSREKALV